jgi:protein-S-isoprenylcysteine O-methyltransferase Ste14
LTIRTRPLSPASSAVAPERAIVWLGGAIFVASLAATVWVYAVRWSGGRPLRASWWSAIGVNLVLVIAFAAHHSLFARAPVKAWVARLVPERLIRSLYVWIASGLWLAVVLAWQPIGGNVFRHTFPIAAVHLAAQVLGLGLIWRSVRAIDALELAGIRPAAATAAGLQVRGPYRLVRHPLYLGWALLVFGAATMTGDRLAFAALTTLYLIVAIPWEERSLEHAFGDAYRHYKATVRWRMLPFVY